MKKGTVYLKENVAPGGMNFVHVYEFVSHTVVGVIILDGQRRRFFYPAHLIQRIEYD